METEAHYAYKPNYAVHPGEYIEEVLESRELTQKDLAERIGISTKHLSQIVNKEAAVNSELALQLEHALGISANILLHGKKDTFIDDTKGFESEEEAAADRFSRNILIPETDYAVFSANTIMTEQTVRAFAQKIGIHPGIVIGRLQHDRRIHYGRLNHLKIKYEFERP